MNDFILVNGDTIFDINLKTLIKSCGKKLGTVALAKNKKNINSLKLNNLSIKNRELSFQSKGKLMNGGIYFFKKNFKFITYKKIFSRK